MAIETTIPGRVGSDLPPHVLAERLRTALRQVEKKLAAPPEQRTQEAWHGQHDVTMRDGLEHLFAQPFGPRIERFFSHEGQNDRPRPEYGIK